VNKGSGMTTKMLGYSSIRQTQHYAKMQNYKVSKDMLLLEENLMNRDYPNK
jgi:hypothetical protein